MRFNSPKLKIDDYVVMPENLDAIEFKLKKTLVNTAEKKALQCLLLANPQGDFQWTLAAKHNHVHTFMNLDGEFNSTLGLGIAAVPMRIASHYCSTDEGAHLIEPNFDGWRTIHAFSDNLRIIIWCYDAEYPVMKRSFVTFMYEKLLTDGTLIWVCWDTPDEVQELFPAVPGTVRGRCDILGLVLRKTYDEEKTAIAHISRFDYGGKLPKIMMRISAGEEVKYIRRLSKYLKDIYHRESDLNVIEEVSDERSSDAC